MRRLANTKFFKCKNCGKEYPLGENNNDMQTCTICSGPVKFVDIAVDGHDGINSDFQIIKGEKLLDHERYILTKYVGNAKRVIVPDMVTEIDDHAFSGCTEIEEVVLPQGVTFIGEHAFSGCEKLKFINMPDNLHAIFDYAFFGCKQLTGVMVRSNVTVELSSFLECDKLVEFWREQKLCPNCGGELKGLFKKVCKRCYPKD